MIAKIHLTKRINHSKNFFSEQYGANEIEKIRIATLNSYETMKFLVTLENQFFPNSDQIMETVIRTDYILEKANQFGMTKTGIEKKIDYMHISSVIILEHWLLNILPKQANNPITRELLGNEETGWIFAMQVMSDLFKKCDELEKDFKF